MKDLIITGFVRTIQLKSDKGRQHYWDKRPFAGICGVVRGEMLFKFDDKEMLCKTNDAIFIPGGTTYTIDYLEETDFVLFDFKTLQKEYEIKKIKSNNLYNNFKLIRNYSMGTNMAKHHYIMAELYKIMSKFSYEEPLGKKERLVSKAEKIIIENFDDFDFVCKNIAESLGISETYLRVIFKEEFGITPGQYLLKTRMSEASDLLVGGLSVTEVAHMVGYRDVFQFSKAYKKHYGYSPKFTKEHYSDKTESPERLYLKK